MPDFMPVAEVDYDQWADNFVAYVNEHSAELGLTADMIAPVNSGHDYWSSAYHGHLAAVIEARSARKRKLDAWDVSRAAIRVMVKRIQGNPDVTSAQKKAMGLRGGTPRIIGNEPAVTRPRGSVDIRQRLQHSISFADEANMGSRAKPKGILGCEIRVWIGDNPPEDMNEMRMIGLAPKPPFVVEYGGEDAGKRAHYAMRWINMKGEAGPWSITVSATIAA